MMIRILFALNGVFSKGGIETVVLSIFNNIDKNKFHIDFLVHGVDENNKIHEKLMQSGAFIYYVTPRYLSYRQNIADIMNVLLNNHFDIVHAHMDISSYFVLRIARKLGIRVRIAHSHNTASQFSQSRSLMCNFAHKMLLEYAKHELRRLSTHFIACSDAAGKWLFGDDICRSDRYLLYRNGINVDEFIYDNLVREKLRKDLKISNNFVIGHIGRFSPQKNHKFLIRVFKEVYNECCKARLLLVGEGELLPQIREEVHKCGLPDEAVIFAGVRSDTYRIYQAMDIMVMPSLYEGLPLVMVEAQASGLKVIASNNVTNEAKLIPETEFLPLSDPYIWIEKILQCSRGYIRKNTKNYIVDAGYSVEDNIKVLENFYKKAIYR